MNYKSYGIRNFREIRQICRLNEDEKLAIEVVGRILPFKVSNYVIQELIDWNNFRDDPLFIQTFPQRDMLSNKHFHTIEELIKSKAPERQITETAGRIRLELNPHPAGQIEKNVPEHRGMRLEGVQHKYPETLLYFPSQGQTCHAYCTFCFRWPQFVGMKNMKIAVSRASEVIGYLKDHPEISDMLITGGDPLTMSAKILERHVDAFLDAHLSHIRTLRIGSKVLSYWPYRFLSDKDSGDLLKLFRKIVSAGKHLAFMASFTHPNELKTNAVRLAIEKIRETGAQIRTQAPILHHINDHSQVWFELWREQVTLGCVPYYMFVPRDTGAQKYFALPLLNIWKIFKGAYQNVSGLCRTIRGPIMSTDPGKVQISGQTTIRGEKVFALQFLQARDPDWVLRPFFAEYSESAIWLDDLRPAFGEQKFFFED